MSFHCLRQWNFIRWAQTLFPSLFTHVCLCVLHLGGCTNFCQPQMREATYPSLTRFLQFSTTFAFQRGLQLTIISTIRGSITSFSINQTIDWSIKRSKLAGKARHEFPESKLTSSNVLFSQTNKPKPNSSQRHSVACYRGEKETRTFEKMEPHNIYHFCWKKNTYTTIWSLKSLPVNWSVDTKESCIWSKNPFSVYSIYVFSYRWYDQSNHLTIIHLFCVEPGSLGPLWFSWSQIKRAIDFFHTQSKRLACYFIKEFFYFNFSR